MIFLLRENSRIFGKPLLLHNKHETRAVANAERKVSSLSFSELLRKQLPTPLFWCTAHKYSLALWVEPVIQLRGSWESKEALLEERPQALLPTVLIALTKYWSRTHIPTLASPALKRVIIWYARLIKLIHIPRLLFEILLLPEDLPQFPALSFTCVQDAKASRCMLFQLDFSLAYLPVCRQLAGFEGKVVPLLGLVRGFEWQDLQRELPPLLFVGLSLLLEVLILVSEVAQACSTSLR
jgi:hypothetical protein